jgi:Carboxymuconolactone decarboxylase family
MPNPALDALQASVARTVDVEDSAILLINGFADRIDAAVRAAIGNGATPEELQPVADEAALLRSKADALAAAIVANTPPPAP